MRKLMWFTLGFGIACALCACFWLDSGLLLAGGMWFFMFCCFLFSSKWITWLRKCAAICLGLSIGFCWYHIYTTQYLAFPTALDGQTIEVTAQCSDYSYQTDYGTAVDTVLHLDGKPYRVRFYVNGEIEMEPGDLLSGTFKFSVTTGAKDWSYHQGEGIFLLAYQQEDAELGKISQMPWWCYPAKLRQRLITLINDTFPADTAFFARALLLGDRTGVDYETNTAFKVSGISHIIAVSGLHVSILFALIYTLGFRKRWPVAIIGIPALLLFAAVAGFSPSITRACIMQCLMILAMIFEKEYDPPTALAFACTAMLTANPLTITSVSFQLSVGCMAGIFLFRPGIRGWLGEKLGCEKKGRGQKLKRWFADSVAVSLSAVTITTPLVAWYFGTISLVGALTNLLTLWAVTIVFYGIMLVCLCGSISLGAGTAVAAIISWPIRYVLGISKLLAKFPLAAVYTRSIYVVIWLIFVYILLLVFLCSRNRRPGTLSCCAVLGLCLALAASWIEPLMDNCRMTMLDVGQGQCIILQSDNKTYLVDCGGTDDETAADLAAETLMSQGVFRLDGIILTHYDRDHSGGMPYLLTRIPVDSIFIPDVADESGLREQLEVETGTILVREDLQVSYGGTDLTIYGPALTGDDNESSLCVLFRKENCDILITGDRSEFGERLLLRKAQLPKLEILVAGHHGSKYSTSVDLLNTTSPNVVAISVGENYYGHPATELLMRLEEFECQVYRTDLHGNIIFRR